MSYIVTKMIWDKMRGSKRGGGSSNLGPVGYAVLGVAAVGLIGGVVGGIVYNTNQRDLAKQELNSAIAQSSYSQGYDVATVDVSTFEWSNENSDYFFKFTGTATNFSGENIDYFAAKYLVNEEQYNEVVNHIEKKNYKTGFESKDIVKKITSAVENSKLVEATLNEQIAVRGFENATDFSSVNDECIILEVSKPIISDDKISYNVCYTQNVKTKDGEIGYVTSFVNVEYDRTEELDINPAAVFAQDKSKAKLRIMDRTYSPLSQYEMVNVQEMC